MYSNFYGVSWLRKYIYGVGARGGIRSNIFTKTTGLLINLTFYQLNYLLVSFGTCVQDEDDKLAELAAKYRDRAAERREGSETGGPPGAEESTTTAYRSGVQSST